MSPNEKFLLPPHPKTKKPNSKQQTDQTLSGDESSQSNFYDSEGPNSVTEKPSRTSKIYREKSRAAKKGNMTSSKMTPSRDFVSEGVITGLKELYHTSLKNIEKRYFFSNFHYHAISDSELESKPQVLLIGQYSTGKTTFIQNLIGQSFPNMHIGPEPTTDKFIAVVHGQEDKVIKGNSLTVVPELPFGGLSGFGASFLNKFEASVTSAELLESVTLIDTPGVLSGEKQRIARAYDFRDVMMWFADRSDLILLLFDAHKLDISDEFRSVIESLRPHDDKVRCVLNKADQINREQLVRVYGSLMWSMGKIFQTPEVARVYCGSYWDQPLVNEDYKEMFLKDEKLLIDELKDLPSSAAARKINEMVKRIRLVKVHVCILSHLKGQMPLLWGKTKKQEWLLENLGNVFDEVQQMYSLSDGDLPDVDLFASKLRMHNFRSFPSLDRKVLRSLDLLIEKDIPALMGRVGGVSGVFNMSSMLEVDHVTAEELLRKKEEGLAGSAKKRHRQRRRMNSRAGRSSSLSSFMIGIIVVTVLLTIVVLTLYLRGIVDMELLRMLSVMSHEKIGAAVGKGKTLLKMGESEL